MTPARVDFGSFNNEVFDIAVGLSHEDNASALDLSAYSGFQMHVRESEAHTVPVLSLAGGAGITVESPATGGVLSLFASEADVTGLLGTYVYDLRALRDGKREVLIYGEIEFLQGKTYEVGS